MNKKEQEAHKTIKKYLWWSAGVSMIPWVCVDMYAVGGVQLKMIADISKIYEIPFSKNIGKVAIASLGGFAVPHAIAFGKALSLFKAVPIVGTMVGSPAAAVLSVAYTWALGNIFVQHFESGGTFLNFDSEKVREHFKSLLAESPKMAPVMETGCTTPADRGTPHA
jgi:uncharacterized protein (DUF697 family)